MTVRAIATVADAYKTNPDTCNSFSIRGGFPYDSRVLTYRNDLNIPHEGVDREAGQPESERWWFAATYSTSSASLARPAACSVG
jgi:hypothetical protein